jgi:hypothetical protein
VGSAKVAVGAALVVLGGAALGYALTRSDHPAPAGMSGPARAAVFELDDNIKTAIGNARVRAETLAGVPQIESVIATNPPTAHDMVERGELRFVPLPDETLALDQVAKDAGAAPVALLVLPDGAAHTPRSAPGTNVELVNDDAGHTSLLVTVATDVQLKYEQAKYRGLVVVTQPYNVSGDVRRLAAASIAGRITLGDKSIAFGAPTPGATEHVERLRSAPELQVVVAIPAPAATGVPVPLVAGGGAAALVGLVLVIAGLARKPAAAAPAVAAPVASGGSTQLSAQLGVATGTRQSTPSRGWV